MGATQISTYTSWEKRLQRLIRKPILFFPSIFVMFLTLKIQARAFADPDLLYLSPLPLPLPLPHLYPPTSSDQSRLLLVFCPINLTTAISQT